MSVALPFVVICAAIVSGCVGRAELAEREPLAPDPPISPRHYYGAPLEPTHGVLHGAGQVHVTDVQAYCEAIAPYRPVIFMDYFNLKGDAARRLAHTRKALAALPTYTVVQLGLSMTSDGRPHLHYEHEVAQGLHDEKIDALCRELAALGVPVYLRIGYECNGSWNGYQPDSYKAAFRRITQRLRAHGGLELATVWCPHPHEVESAMPYYPGDEWVDWWAIDLFGAHEIPTAHPLLALAHEHGKPVMIGEATPCGIGVHGGKESWSAWFEPFFELIRTSPGIKAFCYINWNWTETQQWAQWGDARLQANAVVAGRYREEMARPLYVHGSTEAAFQSLLVKPGAPETPGHHGQ